MSLQTLKLITDQIGQSLALHIDQSNPEEILGKINELSSLLGSSSEAVAMAEMIYSQKIQDLTEDAAFAKMTATDKKMIFAGRAKHEGYYVTLTERQNRALVHAIEGLRSMISYLKSEMENLRNHTA